MRTLKENKVTEVPLNRVTYPELAVEGVAGPAGYGLGDLRFDMLSIEAS